MLSADDARFIAADWRARFTDEAAFELSWTRYFETATVPDSDRLEAWLARDLAKDEVLHAGIVTEPILPTRSRYLQTDCVHCAGVGYVRADVPISDPRFGKALRCPDCNGGHRSEVVSPTDGAPPPRTGNWCYKCGQDELEPPGPTCGNRGWHTPPAVRSAAA